MTEPLPPSPNFYPTVGMPDGHWDRVVRALRNRGTKVDDALAERIDRDVQSARRRRLDRSLARLRAAADEAEAQP